MTKQKTYHEPQSHGYVDDNSILSTGIQGQDIILEDTVKEFSCGKTQLDLNSNTEGFQHTTQRLDPDAGLNKEAAQSLFFTPTHDHCALMLRESNLNWFAFVDELMILLKQYDKSVIEQVLLDFAPNISFVDFTEGEERFTVNRTIQTSIFNSKSTASFRLPRQQCCY